MNNVTPWCVEPFISFTHTADGYYRPCCIGTVDRLTGPNVNNMSPLEYFTGKDMNELRKDMITKTFSEKTKLLCQQCFKNDSDNISSRRINQNNFYKDNNVVQSIFNKYSNSAYIATADDLIYVNFKILGNLCNLKCLMCGPSASSKIAAEWKKHNIFNHGSLEKIERVPYGSESEESYMQDLKIIIEKIQGFNLVGGEAFINPNFNNIWKILSNSSNSKNLKLLIITNGTLIPQYVLDDAEKFRSLNLLFSIDGVYERGSYVRSGLNWQLFDSNVKRSLQSKAHVSFTVATSILNIGYLDEIYDYLKLMDIGDHVIQWNAVVTDPQHLRAVNLPFEIKQLYLKKLLKHEAFRKNNKNFNSVLDILKSENGEHDQFLKGIAFLKLTDKIRNTKLLNYYPEFERYYNND
jgi:MoaA/NifB/PqqE/SkfB family radical SAM enzyme